MGICLDSFSRILSTAHNNFFGTATYAQSLYPEENGVRTSLQGALRLAQGLQDVQMDEAKSNFLFLRTDMLEPLSPCTMQSYSMSFRSKAYMNLHSGYSFRQLLEQISQG
jgi:hypothetical protein